MIVLDKRGQHTDKFEEYSSNILNPLIEAATASAIQWLIDNNAPPIDFRTIQDEVISEIMLDLSSAWMTEIEKLELAEWKKDKDNE